MEGNYEVYEYALSLWGWGMNQAGEGTIGTDIYNYNVDMLAGYDM